MCRYAEGAGTAALFTAIKDIDFLSSTELICADENNHCLRLVDLSLSPPETSTFAGSCTMSGVADGHRVNSASLYSPMYTEVNNNNSFLFVLGLHGHLSRIDLTTDIVTALVTFAVRYCDMKILGDSLLYVTQEHQITLLNIDTGEENVIAGAPTDGRAAGSFEHTRFYLPFDLLPWRDEVNTLLLVADHANNRFASFTYNLRIQFVFSEYIVVIVRNNFTEQQPKPAGAIISLALYSAIGIYVCLFNVSFYPTCKAYSPI